MRVCLGGLRGKYQRAGSERLQPAALCCCSWHWGEVGSPLLLNYSFCSYSGNVFKELSLSEFFHFNFWNFYLSDAWSICWEKMLIQEWGTNRVTVQCTTPQPMDAHCAWNWCVQLLPWVKLHILTRGQKIRKQHGNQVVFYVLKCYKTTTYNFTHHYFISQPCLFVFQMASETPLDVVRIFYDLLKHIWFFVCSSLCRSDGEHARWLQAKANVNVKHLFCY